MKASLLLALALAASAPAFSAEPPAAQPNRYAASIVPAERFEVGPVLVERHGSRGRPLILIPGLASGAWVWQDMVREFSGEHVVYVLTLPGFDGRPRIEGEPLVAARKALVDLIAARKLDKPVLVGHSLGGIVAFALAEQNPELVGGIVAIDGLPVFPGTEGMPPEQRLQVAEATRARMAAASPDAFAAQQQAYMRGIGVLDMAKADELAKLTANSDPAAVAQYVAAALALDLRPGLGNIKAPVMVLAPYFEADATQGGITEAQKVEYYKSLVAGTPNAEVVAIAPARHFAMFDQPRKVDDAVRRFLKSL